MSNEQYVPYGYLPDTGSAEGFVPYERGELSQTRTQKPLNMEPLWSTAEFVQTCEGIRKDGTSCESPPKKGERFCVFHQEGGVYKNIGGATKGPGRL